MTSECRLNAAQSFRMASRGEKQEEGRQSGGALASQAREIPVWLLLTVALPVTEHDRVPPAAADIWSC